MIYLRQCQLILSFSVPISDIFDSKYSSDWSNLVLYWKAGLTTTQYALENANVQQFIEQDDTDFDLVISEQFYQEAFLMFAHKYRAPIVTIGLLLVRLVCVNLDFLFNSRNPRLCGLYGPIDGTTDPMVLRPASDLAVRG